MMEAKEACSYFIIKCSAYSTLETAFQRGLQKKILLYFDI